jgi:hypothetical protein
MNYVHYIWIGNNEIPLQYLNNYNKCLKLNPQFSFNIWKNEDCLKLVEEYKLTEIFNSLSFICKCNLLKYIVLDKFGGIYTDFDIDWKQPFIKISNNFNFPIVDIVLTITENPILFDDPFIISKQGILGDCIEYCKNRTNLKYDGELYLNTNQIKIHKLEPFGPFGLTEWINEKKINVNYFHQDTLLDHKGFFGIHEQKSTWKN